MDHTNFADMQQSLSGKIIVDKMVDEFEMFFAFKEASSHLQNYSYRDHVELQVLSKEMFTLDFASADQWKTMEK